MTDTENVLNAVDGLRKAEAFAKEHLVECCEEMVNWRRTGVLEDGRMRELAEIVGPDAYASRLLTAERLVSAMAVQRVAEASERDKPLDRIDAIKLGLEAHEFARGCSGGSFD